MIRLSLQSVDATNTNDQLFCYEVLKYRWQNIEWQQIKYRTKLGLPTMEEHINNMQTNYLCMYKIMIGDSAVGTIHVSKKKEGGLFVLPSQLRKALYKYRIENIELNDISQQAFNELFDKHPEIDIIYASANPKNKLSQNALVRAGFKINEFKYIRTR
ncbi:MAG: hypothetical protein EBX50_09765 [Chitinophagia bacterium]|nr:hypothetical protein [Chitinophagia bacterium]